jgi:uncharacterized membrane protein HdeD (DUF308 family)
MATTDHVTHHTESWSASWWQSLLLGAVLVAAGLYVLLNAVSATMISAFLFGIALLVAGLFEIVQAFWAPHWSGVAWRLAVGAFYAIGGAILINDPLAASVLLTLAFAAALIASGAVRMFLAMVHWENLGWLLLTSGIFGVLAGAVLLAKWPISGLWFFGALVGVDLILHGLWWITSGWSARQETAVH